MRAPRLSPLQLRTMILAGLAAFTLGFWAILLSGAASAALFRAPPKASDTLALSRQEQQAVWNDLRGIPSEDGPANFRPSITSAVPSTVQVRAVRGKAAGDVPTLSAYDFAKVQHKLLIINPRDMMIAEVIAG
jgi:hypothetical protein